MTEESTTTEVQVTVEDGRVKLEFSKLLKWVTWSPKSAKVLGKLVMEAAEKAERQVQ